MSISYAQLLTIENIAGVWANYLLPVVLIGYTIWWARSLRNGAKIHRSTLGLHIGVYGLAAVYVYLVSWLEFYGYGDRLEIVGTLWMLGALAIAYIAIRLGMWYGARTLVVVRTEAGHWHLRGPIEIALFWAGLFATRFALETFVLQGYSVFFPVSPLPTGISDTLFVSVVMLVAALYLVSFGFLCGVSITEWNLHGELVKASRRVGPGPAMSPSGPDSPAVVAAPPVSQLRA
ncbi:MAG: hypothetical protein ACREB9_02740 [Thermoplasmata archaeon]